jgi:NagD protein
MNRRGLTAREVVMVGDRVYTDMLMAREAGVLGALTLTGEATRDEVIAPASTPDLIINDLGELEALLRSSRSIPL